MLLWSAASLPNAAINAASYLDRYGNENTSGSVTALLAALNDNITTIYFPAGTYVIPGGVFIIKRSNVSVVGAGIGATTIKMADDTSADQGAIIQIADYSDESIRGTVENCSVSNLTLDGNRENQYLGTAAENGVNSGLVVEDAKDILVERVEAKNCDGYGIGIVGSDLAHREDLTVKDCFTHDNLYDGMDIKSGFQRATIDGLTTYNNGTVLAGTDPIATTDTSGSVVITVPSWMDWFAPSGTITLYGAAATNGITAAQLNTALTITAVNGNLITATTAGTATSTGSGGGSVVYIDDSPISGRDSVGLDIRGDYINVLNVTAYNGSDVGIRRRVNAGDNGTMVQCNAYGNHQDGITLDGADTATASVSDCQAVANGRYGVQIINGHYSLSNVICDSNVSFGLSVSANVEHVGLDNCQFCYNTLDGINIDSSTLIINATGCLFKSNSRRGADIGKGGLRATGCTFASNVEGILFDTTTVDSILVGCSFRGNSAESIQYTGTNSGSYHYVACVFADTTDESGTPPTNRVVKHCIGLADT